MKRIFVINPGCTSTKVAVYEDDKAVWTSDGLHPQEEIDKFMTVDDQYEYRKDFVLNLLLVNSIHAAVQGLKQTATTYYGIKL